MHSIALRITFPILCLDTISVISRNPPITSKANAALSPPAMSWNNPSLLSPPPHHLQVYSDSLGFWIVFFLLYVVSSFIFSVEVYYRWQVKRKSLKYLFQMYRRKSVWPPQHYVSSTVCVCAYVWCVWGHMCGCVCGVGVCVVWVCVGVFISCSLHSQSSPSWFCL